MLMGVETQNKSGWEEIVTIAAELRNSEGGGLGNGSAISVHLAIPLNVSPQSPQTICHLKLLQT